MPAPPPNEGPFELTPSSARDLVDRFHPLAGIVEHIDIDVDWGSGGLSFELHRAMVDRDMRLRFEFEEPELYWKQGPFDADVGPLDLLWFDEPILVGDRYKTKKLVFLVFPGSGRVDGQASAADIEKIRQRGRYCAGEKCLVTIEYDRHARDGYMDPDLDRSESKPPPAADDDR